MKAEIFVLKKKQHEKESHEIEEKTQQCVREGDLGTERTEFIDKMF